MGQLTCADVSCRVQDAHHPFELDLVESAREWMSPLKSAFSIDGLRREIFEKEGHV
jgi:hypothetical protein